MTRRRALLAGAALGAYLALFSRAEANPAVVQAGIANASGNYNTTLGAAPTSGNLMVGVCWDVNAVPTANTGWTSEASGSQSPGLSGIYYWRLVLRIVSGDGATVTPCTGGDASSRTTVSEVSGAASTITSAYQGSTQGSAYRATPTLTLATSAANTLGVGSASNTGNGAGAPQSCTGTTSHTDQLSPNSIACSGLVATSGANSTFSPVPNGGTGSWGTVGVLVLIQPPVAAPVVARHRLIESANDERDAPVRTAHAA